MYNISIFIYIYTYNKCVYVIYICVPLSHPLAELQALLQEPSGDVPEEREARSGEKTPGMG